MKNKYDIEIKNIAEWMKNYLKESGCKGYVIGISGGIDSAVCLSILKKIISSKNIIAVALPCNSNENSLIDAIQLTDNLNIDLRVFNLIDSYNAIIKEMEAGGETVDKLTMANTKARLRMTMLFALANQYNYLVAGTGNKSELDIGYCTVGGDQISSIEPLGNYYKTEVYKMASLMPEIPKSIISKSPSADLWDGQTDEEEIGMTYEKLDKILYHYHIDSGQYLNWQDGTTEEDFNKVKNMIKKSLHKNNLPPKYERK